MSVAAVRTYLRAFGRENDIMQPAASTATVQLAAQALGTEPARIAKTLSVYRDGGALLIVAAGDAKLDNKRFRARFGFKPRMLAAGDVERLTGHPPGGVCPFAVAEGVPVFLDESLRRFDHVFPACGSPHSAIRLSLPELEEYAHAAGWVAVCKIPE